MTQAYKNFLNDILQFMPRKRVYTDELRTLAWGTDASFYRLIPQIVIITENEAEVQQIMKAASNHQLPVTFRAAGTSLAGQSVTDSILIVAGKGWENYTISPDASTIKVQPGIVGNHLNEILKPYGRMFTPDPASKNSAMVGGIIANNASGMNCGTHANSDKILRSVRLVFADGSILDTSDPDSRQRFARSHPLMMSEIRDIRDAIMADDDLVRRIRYKYSIKNVTGLNLLPFVTFTDPFDIISHCIVGSEGTLAFLSEATLKTEHLYSKSASAMVYFHDMAEASRCVVGLKTGAPVFSCEMLDAKSLDAVHDDEHRGLTALLLDTKTDTDAELEENIEAIKEVLTKYELASEPIFSTDPAVTGHWWSLRSGIFPAVGGTRKPGTTVLIEDVAFHIADLPRATMALEQLLKDCGYDDACIYGHALEGNYHFIISQSFETPEEVARYRHLMEELEKLVIDRFDGSLKAEHGVGRNMAPFIEKEWGPMAWSYMRRIKDAFDPSCILNRGAVFNPDPNCFVENIKPLPVANPIIDKCIECGFCEVNCVSCGFTLSARQRIVIVREMARLRKLGTPEALARLHRLEKGYKYLGDKTCATDGLCSTSCPMSINTGDLTHYIREEHLPKGSLGYKVGNLAANHFAAASEGLRLTLGLANVGHAVLGNKGVNITGSFLHKLGLPLWTAALPKPYKPNSSLLTPHSSLDENVVVYFPSCMNRAMGVSEEKDGKVAPLVDTMVNLCRKAGYRVVFPEGMDKLCCGMIWESKGMPDIADRMTAELEAALIKASENGRYPVLCDQSPCLHRMRKHIKSLKLYEPAEFINKILAPHLTFHKTDEPVAIHITCSTRLMGLGSELVELASRCSSNVTVPTEIGCCGFAGDKGFTVPELNKWALRKLRPIIEQKGIKAGYSNSRTCEVGLTYHSGVSYKSIAYLVDACTESL